MLYPCNMPAFRLAVCCLLVACISGSDSLEIEPLAVQRWPEFTRSGDCTRVRVRVISRAAMIPVSSAHPRGSSSLSSGPA